MRRREAGGGADHRRVVGAELARDQLQAHAAAPRRAPATALAQRAVGGDAAAERDRLPVALLQRPLQFRDQLADDGRLEGGGEVGAALGHPLGAELAAAVDERRLEAAEAEVEAGVAGHRDRQLERLRVALGGQLLQRRAARVAEAEQPRRLVEGLAGGVVEGLAEHLVAAVVADRRPAACGRRWRPGRGTAARAARARGSWRRRGPAGGRPGSAAAAARAAIALAVLTPTSRAPIRPGPGGDRDRLDVVERRPRPRASAASTTGAVSSRWWREATSGTTPPKSRVRRRLGGDHVGEDPRAVEDGRAGVVAGGLDREACTRRLSPAT